MDRHVPGTLLKHPAVPKVSQLLQWARFYPCSHCNGNDGTVVAAHCNELALGRGFAHKTPDYLTAYLCADCHDAVDGRKYGLTKEEKRAMWNRAFVVTVSWLWRDGRIKVA